VVQNGCNRVVVSAVLAETEALVGREGVELLVLLNSIGTNFVYKSNTATLMASYINNKSASLIDRERELVFGSAVKKDKLNTNHWQQLSREPNRAAHRNHNA
jgi:hypothetical protein